MSKIEEISNLALELTDVALEPYEQYVKAKKIYELSLPIELNENQQIVLDFLIKQCEPEGNLYLAVEALCDLMWDNQLGVEYEKVREANFRLSRNQHAEVLQAFAEWGLGHERNIKS